MHKLKAKKATWKQGFFNKAKKYGLVIFWKFSDHYFILNLDLFICNYYT